MSSFKDITGSNFPAYLLAEKYNGGTSTIMARILHISKSWLPQTQTWMFTQVRHLSPELECHIFCERTENLDQFKLPHIRVFDRHTNGFRNLWDRGFRALRLRPHLGAMASAAKRLKPKVVHSHFGFFGWKDIPIAKQCAAAHVTTFYGVDVNQVPRQYPVWLTRYRELFQSGDLFLCEGSHMAACIEKLGCPGDKIKVHHLGIDLHQFPFVPRTYQSGKTLNILMAASFNEKKGLVYGVEALGLIRRDIPLKLTLIGDAPNTPGCGEEKKKILKAIEHNALTGHTRLLGYQPYSKLIEEAYGHHLFLSPSVTASDGDTEGGAPISVIEMAAGGMPVVSTRHCDISEILDYENDDLLAHERDARGLAEIIRKWIDAPGLWRSRLLKARKHIEKEYNAITQGERLSQIYRNFGG
jgi:colanic acid/amylovoran biosynthesis glycosyltransferase